MKNTQTKTETILSLKIGRKEYDITAEDRFMDNGHVVQLLTQSKERVSWGHRPNPCLSKRAEKELNKLGRVQDEHTYGDNVQVFGVKS